MERSASLVAPVAASPVASGRGRIARPRRAALWLAVLGLSLVAALASASARARVRCPKGTRPQVQRSGGRARVEQCVRRSDGVQHGPYLRLKRNGSVAETGRYQEGERDGPWMHRFLLSSDSGSYTAGVKQGKWITKLDTGERHELHYLDGKLHGELRKFDARGKALEHERYADGEPDGAWSGLWSDGRKRYEGRYAAGKRVGLWRWWYEDGSVEREVAYVDGLEQGPARLNWPGGAPWERGSYDHGERDGLWIGSLDDGSELYRGQWRKGEQIGSWVWPADGDAAAGGRTPTTAAPQRTQGGN